MVPNLQSFESDFKYQFFLPNFCSFHCPVLESYPCVGIAVWVGGVSLDIYNFFYIPAKARATWSQDLVLATVVDREV